MVFLERLKLDVCVMVNGEQAPEFDVPEDQHLQGSSDNPQSAFTSVVNKYIEVTEDAEFLIRVTARGSTGSRKLWPDSDHGVTCLAIVDGNEKSPAHIMKETAHPPTHLKGFSQVVEGAAGSAKLHRWRFRSIQTTDETSRERVKEGTRAAKNLGLIQLKIFRVDRLRKIAPTVDKFTSFQSLEALPEKALKGRAISHGTSFANPVSISLPHQYDVRYFDSSTNQRDRPIAIFNFHYRSSEALKCEGVRPRTPSPAAEDSVDDLSNDQLRQLAKERLEQLRVKREQQGVAGRTPKREIDLTDIENIPPARPFKMTKTRDGQDAIDLTDD